MTALVAVPAAGALYETYAESRDANRMPPPGVLIDVGGRRLHLLCVGEGEPVVIVESSGLGSALSAGAARAEIAAHTRVCSYDRLGMGWSDRGPGVVSVGLLADDLWRVQERAAIGPPFVLVAASVGGLTVEMFARRHPERVAGLVFLDAATSHLLHRVEPYRSSARAAACLATGASRLGLVRLLDPLRLRQSGAGAAAAITYRTAPWATLCAMVRGLPTTRQSFSARRLSRPTCRSSSSAPRPPTTCCLPAGNRRPRGSSRRCAKRTRIRPRARRRAPGGSCRVAAT